MDKAVGSMKNLNLVEITAFVPAKDFEGAIFLPKK